VRGVALIAGMSILLLCPACATYRTTVTDPQGRSVTCEASGKSGLITGMYLRQGFDDCVAAAKRGDPEPQRQ
jgi:hypothetical protein